MLVTIERFYHRQQCLEHLIEAPSNRLRNLPIAIWVWVLALDSGESRQCGYLGAFPIRALAGQRAVPTVGPTRNDKKCAWSTRCATLAAENLFLRKQLAFYKERRIRPRRTSHPARLTLLWLSRWFNWRSALTVVTPKTFIGWHRKGFQLFWRRKCQSGRPRIPPDLQRLIRKMAGDNPSWGEERIANELLLKLGLRVSPRTIRKYLAESPTTPTGNPHRDQRWSTFLKNHADAIIACDFCVVASATFRILYVLVVMEHASRRIIHLNVTAHPTAAWTLQQLREAIPSDHTYRFILHDRDAIFSTGFDASVAHMGLEVIVSFRQACVDQKP